MRVRRRSVEFDAHIWWRNGDHPLDGDSRRQEGRFVRLYRHPDHSGVDRCPHCEYRLYRHGWIDTDHPVAGGAVVCPGDYVLTGNDGELFVVQRSLFEALYERID